MSGVFPTDAQMHAELNHHDRLRRAKAIMRAMRHLEKSVQYGNAADDNQLTPQALLEKRQLLAEADRILDAIAAAMAEGGTR